MPTILFLCVHNSVRSQMAEGLARAQAPPEWRFLSAGSRPAGVNPLAVQTLREIGIDISRHDSKNVASIDLTAVNTIVTLCAEEVCPVVPGATQHLHWPIADPGATEGSMDARLEAFRATRDRLREQLPQLWRDA